MKRNASLTLFGACLLYSLWKERHDIIFSGKHPDLFSFLENLNAHYVEHLHSHVDLEADAEEHRGNPINKSKKKDLHSLVNEKITDVRGAEGTIFTDAAWKENSSCPSGVCLFPG